MNIEKIEWPEWAGYLTKDSDGFWMWHEQQPEWSEDLGAWVSTGVVDVCRETRDYACGKSHIYERLAELSE